MRIACIGDSVTFGQNVRATQAWPHLLHILTGHDVRNLGVNGDTTRLGLERWHRDVDLSKPDIVVVQFGHNDANEWHGRPRVSKDAYVQNISEMRGKAVEAGATKFIILAPHDTPDKDAAYKARLRAYQGELQTVADASKPLPIPLLEDGYHCHPSPYGHSLYAEHVAGQL